MRLDHLLSREQEGFQKATESSISRSYGEGVPNRPSVPRARVSGPRGSYPAYLESRIATDGSNSYEIDLIDSSYERYEITNLHID